MSQAIREGYLHSQISIHSSWWGGWVRQRCHVSCVTWASNWYWLTVGQGLLSLQQVRVEGECFYFFGSSLSFIFLFSPVHLFHFLYNLSSPFLWEMTQNDPQGLMCCWTPTQSIHSSWMYSSLSIDSITKTYQYNFDPFKPHLYIVKLGL